MYIVHTSFRPNSHDQPTAESATTPNEAKGFPAPQERLQYYCGTRCYQQAVECGRGTPVAPTALGLYVVVQQLNDIVNSPPKEEEYVGYNNYRLSTPVKESVNRGNYNKICILPLQGCRAIIIKW